MDNYHIARLSISNTLVKSVLDKIETVFNVIYNKVQYKESNYIKKQKKSFFFVTETLIIGAQK